MRVGRWVLLALIGIGVPEMASAQDVGQTGITMGYPESIGLLWHVTDKVAVRPEFSFNHSTTDTNVPFINDSISSTAVGVGASVLFYLKQYDSLRTYVAPQWTYDHAGPGSGTTSHANSISGLFGAQYALGKRFSVFGETGLAFSRSTAKGDVAIATTDVLTVKGNSFGTRTGAGVILYF